MSSSQDASMEAGQTVSNETKTAVTADNLDKEIEDFSLGEKGHEQDPDKTLEDYNGYDPNGEDPVPALKRRATYGKVDPRIRKIETTIIFVSCLRNGGKVSSIKTI